MSLPDGSHDADGPDDFVDADAAEVPLSTFQDELIEAFGTPRSTFVGGGYARDVESLPQQQSDADISDAHAPPFLRSNQCCIADRSEFVVRDARGQVVVTLPPTHVERDPDGKYRVEIVHRVASSAGSPCGRETWTDGWETEWVLAMENPEGCPIDDEMWVEVEPKRRECVHLVRQLTPPTPSQVVSGAAKLGWMRRYCAARPTPTGGFLDLTDQQITACSMRAPFDATTTAKLDAFDDQLEKRSETREYVDMFDLTKKFLAPLEREETQETP